MKRGLVIFFSLLAIIAITLIGIQITGNQIVGLPQQNLPNNPTGCTDPTINPVITTTQTLCPGTYNGISLFVQSGARLDCNGATLDGAGTVPTGIWITDASNITINNCNIIGYTQAGIYLKGTTPGTTANILLRNNQITGNPGNGIELAENTELVTLKENTLISNKNGILLHSTYQGYGTDPYAKLFPHNILLTGNNIQKNSENGVLIDGHAYHADYTPYKHTISSHLRILNNEITHNNKNGIHIYGYNSGNRESNIINNNLEANNGSGIEIEYALSQQLINQSMPHETGIRMIAFNNIKQNKKDGITITQNNINLPSQTYPYIPLPLETYANIYANAITQNERYGIQAIAKNKTTLIGRDYLNITITQNKLSNNLQGGAYLYGAKRIVPLAATPTELIMVNMSIKCNDFLEHYPNDGLRIEGYMHLEGNIEEQNLFEKNYHGAYLSQDYSGIYINQYYRNNSHKNNTIGLASDPPQYALNWPFGKELQVFTNDFNHHTFEEAVIYDYGVSQGNFSENWWEDYSPTCLTNTPTAQWCNTPRVIPEIQGTGPGGQIIGGFNEEKTKAGTAWGHGSRTNHQESSQHHGVIPKTTCLLAFPEPSTIQNQTNTTIPQIPTNNNNNQPNNNQPPKIPPFNPGQEQPQDKKEGFFARLFG